MDFNKFSFDVSHHSSTGDLHRARTKVHRVSYTGDSFASTSSVLTKWLFGEIPHSRGCDESYERLQIVLFTLGDLESNAVYNATADVLLVPRELEVMAMEWEGRAGPYASRRTLSRGNEVARSPPTEADEDTHAV